ncbi:aconitate hydratase 1 [Salmonella enterica subsp. enterica]|nr:aconitate hydratase 1 [Salmonella enterica subsp. enterica]
MQDFTACLPLSTWRRCVKPFKRLGGDTSKVNPLSPVDLVIDHSVTVDHFGDDDAFEENVRLEMERNHERYMFLKWGKAGIQPFQRGAARHRHLPSRLTWNTWVKPSGANYRTGSGLLTRTRWWGLTPIRP